MQEARPGAGDDDARLRIAPGLRSVAGIRLTRVTLPNTRRLLTPCAAAAATRSSPVAPHPAAHGPGQPPLLQSLFAGNAGVVNGRRCSPSACQLGGAGGPAQHPGLGPQA